VEGHFLDKACQGRYPSRANDHGKANQCDTQRPADQAITSISACSGHLLPPSPPTEQATASKDQAGKASTGDGTGDGGGGNAEIGYSNPDES
jgi:hypothetical protein